MTSAAKDRFEPNFTDFLLRGEGRLLQNGMFLNRLTAENFQISQHAGCRRLPPADVCLG